MAISVGGKAETLAPNQVDTEEPSDDGGLIARRPFAACDAPGTPVAGLHRH